MRRWGVGLCRRGSDVGCCRQDDGICNVLGWGSQRRGFCQLDDAPGSNGGIVAGRTTLQAIVGVLATQGRGKKNELLGPKGTAWFVQFVG